MAGGIQTKKPKNLFVLFFTFWISCLAGNGRLKLTFVIPHFDVESRNKKQTKKRGAQYKV